MKTGLSRLFRKRTLRRLLRRAPLFASLLFTIFAAQYVYDNYRPATVRAFGHLSVDLGVPSGQPIFVVSNMLPGDPCEIRTISVTNDGPSPAEVWVKSENESDVNNLSQALIMTISDNSSAYFTGTLAVFFTDGSPTSLSTTPAGESKDYVFEICFPPESGNEYQNGMAQFDLVFGEILPDIELPQECSHLEGIITARIDGTPGNDKIRGTSASELIIGYGGKDKLDGAGGHDCIVGGDGNDKIDGGDGNDVIIAGGGKDDIDGGDNDDLIYAGPGNDKVDGGHGEDIIYGGDGDDDLDGRSGNDIIYGGPGDDKLDGGAGDDELYGEDGDDKLDGSSGYDYLDGGPGYDSARGGPKTDTCIAEKKSSCEL